MTLSSHTQPLDDGTTVTGTIVFGGACAVDDTIVITDAAGTSKTFTAKGSTTAGSLQFINTDAAAAATALKTCIDNAAGFETTSITVADDSSGTLTLTLVANATYRFKNKASIQLASDITNVTSVDFGGNAAAEDVDGHTIVGGGTVGGFNSKGNVKSNLDTVKGRKSSGSKVIAKTGTATKPGIENALASGGTLAYNPMSRAVTLSSDDPDGYSSTANTGFLIRGGSSTLLSGKASTDDVLAIPGENTAASRDRERLYHRKGTWATQIFDIFGSNLLQSDGTAKAGITGRGTTVTLDADHTVLSSRGVPGELIMLFDFATFTNNYKDYSALNG